MPSDVLVVGGGVGGLVAARRLALEGLSVTLLERSDTLGGQVARQHVGGVDLDAAAESFATRGGTVAALLRELGIADDIVTPRPSPAWLHRVDGTAEFNQGTIAGSLYDPTSIFRNFGINDLASVCLERCEGTFLVNTH